MLSCHTQKLRGFAARALDVCMRPNIDLTKARPESSQGFTCPVCIALAVQDAESLVRYSAGCLCKAASHLKLIHSATQAEMLKDTKQELCSLSRAVDFSVVRFTIQQHIPQLVRHLQGSLSGRAACIAMQGMVVSLLLRCLRNF